MQRSLALVATCELPAPSVLPHRRRISGVLRRRADQHERSAPIAQSMTRPSPPRPGITNPLCRRRRPVASRFDGERVYRLYPTDTGGTDRPFPRPGVRIPGTSLMRLLAQRRLPGPSRAGHPSTPYCGRWQFTAARRPTVSSARRREFDTSAAILDNCTHRTSTSHPPERIGAMCRFSPAAPNPRIAYSSRLWCPGFQASPDLGVGGRRVVGRVKVFDDELLAPISGDAHLVAGTEFGGATTMWVSMGSVARV